jgi:Ni/Co efflux regulator RcnB
VQVQQQQQQAYDRQRGGWNRDQADRSGWSRDRSNWNGGGAVQVQNYDRSGSWARDRGSWSHNRDGDYRQRQGDQSQYRDRTRWASGSWDRNWRNDRRYDWRRYRDSHRSVFHLGIYYDPFGYRYQPFNIGYRLSPVYFGENYWIDPGLYGLPYPPPGAQWVRYWNDAVLVDMYSGEVIDVIRDFFW